MADPSSDIPLKHLSLVKTLSAWRSERVQLAMFVLLIRILIALRSMFEDRASREAEILVLRQQLLEDLNARF